jgi:hypothetical protein
MDPKIPMAAENTFRSLLCEPINLKHPLAPLADLIN